MTRRPLRDRLGRALSETLADYRHDVRTARTRWARAAARWSLVIAIARLLVARAPGRDAEASGGRLGHARRDVTLAVRMLLSHRWASAAAILSLSLAIAGVTVVFGIAERALWHPVPYADPDRLAVVWLRFDADEQHDLWLSPPDARDLESVGVFEGVSAMTDLGFNVSRPGAEPETVEALAVSASWLGVLGERPIAGRWFEAAEDVRNGPQVTVLSRSLARRLFGDAGAAVGASLQFDGRPYRVVGVIADDSALPPLSSVFPLHVGVYVPFSASLPPQILEDRTRHFVHAIVRLRRGASPAQIQAELARLASQVAPVSSYYAGKSLGYRTVALIDQISGAQRPTLGLLAASVLFVLLLACTNLAHLTAAWTSLRRAEFGVRLALGASRGRLAAQLVTESLVLTLTAAGVGLAAAAAALKGLVALAPDGLGVFARAGLDWRVWAVAIGLGVLTGLGVGLPPALRASRAVTDSISGQRAVAGSRRSTRVRRGLVVAQAGLAAALVLLTGLVVKSFVRLTGTDAGFQPRGVTVLRVNLPGETYPEEARASAAWRALLERLQSLPGVEQVAAISQLPLSGAVRAGTFTAVGGGLDRAAAEIDADHRAVSPDYFRALGIPLRAGRAFTAADAAGGADVAIVDETMAQRMWGGANPIGRRLRWTRSDRPIEVVGVVGGVRHASMAIAPRETVYRPIAQLPQWSLWLVARSRGGAIVAASEIAAAIHAVDPSLPASGATALETIVAASTARQRFASAALAMLALVAVVLAFGGVHAVLSQMVAEERRELVIRLALGAPRGQLMWRVTREAIAAVLAGAVIGVSAGLAGARAIRSLLFGVQPLDVEVIAGGVALLLVLAVLASASPARRIGLMDPAAALRGD